MNRAKTPQVGVIEALAAVLPAEALLTEPESMRPYEDRKSVV